MDREQHLQWAKGRALEYADSGDLGGAIASMISDLSKHPETAEHPAINLTQMLMMSGKLDTTAKVVDHINGFR